MSSTTAHRRRVLFVDDDASFLATLAPLMQELSAGAWEIVTAESANRAFSVLQDRPADLAVLDIEMSVVDGIQLLALLNRGYPQMRKVVLTGFATEKNRVACLANGAELFLEKPNSRDGWQSLYTALHELLRFQHEHGFRGVLRRVGLQDVLQMECLARSSSVLEVSDGQQHGMIFVEEGRILHAQFGLQSGVEAFNQLLALRGGQFNLQPFTSPPACTIEGQWEFLLMEAARKRDELQAAAPPPAADAAGSEHPAARAQARVETLLGLTEAGDLSPPPQPRPPIGGLLVCSAQGEILHEWQVPNRAAWISFFEFLSQRAQRLAQGLALGDFDRLEIDAPEGCSLVLITTDGGVLVSAGKSATQVRAPASAPAGAALRDSLTTWLQQFPPAPGELFRALRFADKTHVCGPEPPSFPRTATEPAWRCVADAYQVLIANGVAAVRLTWHYQHAVLHCARRADGTVLGVFTTSDAAKVDLAALGRLHDEFLNVPVG